MTTLSISILPEYSRFLYLQEKSRHTIEKYKRDVRAFILWLGGCPLSKEQVMKYKEDLLTRGYAVSSINSMLASINSLLHYIGREECRVAQLRMQKSPFGIQEKELSREEYLRLLKAAENNPRLYMILETICSTGIRVSELKYITVEAVMKKEVEVLCKNKIRKILLPELLCEELLKFTRLKGIRKGPIFLNRNGQPINRTSIWASMKRLCSKANVAASKVFPHNLRKLFARMFYSLDKDIAKLADTLGHSSIETTRIYIKTTSTQHRALINKMKLIVKMGEEDKKRTYII